MIGKDGLLLILRIATILAVCHRGVKRSMMASSLAPSLQSQVEFPRKRTSQAPFGVVGTALSHAETTDINGMVEIQLQFSSLEGVYYRLPAPVCIVAFPWLMDRVRPDGSAQKRDVTGRTTKRI